LRQYAPYFNSQAWLTFNHNERSLIFGIRPVGALRVVDLRQHRSLQRLGVREFWIVRSAPRGPPLKKERPFNPFALAKPFWGCCLLDQAVVLTWATGTPIGVYC
jgi:hypothetical protein